MSTKDATSAGHKRPRQSEEAVSGSGEKHTVYLEGLPYSATEDDIRSFFEAAGGIVDIRAPKYQDTGRLRGYAHVDFKNKTSATKALEKDGAYLGGRFINVAPAKPEGAGRDATMGFSSRPRPGGCTTLFVKGLPYETDEGTVKAVFSKFGNVTSVRLARWNHTSKLKGFGYVQFEHGYSAEAAMKQYRAAFGDAKDADGEAVGIEVGGRRVHLDYDTAAPRQSFKTAEGVNFYKTDEAAVVKQQQKKVSRREEKKSSKKDADGSSDDEGDRAAKRPRKSDKDAAPRKASHRSARKESVSESDGDLSDE